MSRVVKLAVIPGDGIGPEVIAEAEKVLDAVTADSGVTFDKTRFSLGAARYLETGDTLTDEDLAAIAAHDAILLGAVGGTPGDPRLKDANIERGLLLKLRFTLDHYEVANETSVNTAFGVERVVRYAFDLAERRRKKVTLVHKTNVLVHAGAIWQRIVNEVAAEHPDVAVDYLHVDAATIFLVTDPSRFDVIVTDNLFGDILTDLAGAVTGGIGLAASGNINPDGAFPSMFEPVHGSAPDIAGQQKADPTAAILSIALLLDHLGLTAESARVSAAVEADIAARSGRRSTAEIGAAITAPPLKRRA
ncbi:hypothetical protein HA402_006770 [Bradysia odoriphaga]|nr:hypothetical protein HA402_006770 [Bradysia odoriphaga]